MKIQYASDLHLEFPINREFIQQNPIQVAGDILVLAGDIRKLTMRMEDEFLRHVSKQFKSVFIIPGNHEFYGKETPIELTFPSFKRQIEDNVFYLNNETIHFAGVRILFSTLFTKVSPVNEEIIKHSLSDFHVSRYHSDSKLTLTVKEYNQCHEKCLAYLEQELRHPFDGKTVVVTHHAPFLKNRIPNYPSFLFDLSDAFHVDLTWMTEKYRIDHWISGHTHVNFPSFAIGNTMFHSNMLGYVEYNENRDFDFARILDL